jgi:Ca2+-binding RTX toxin-like protein
LTRETGSGIVDYPVFLGRRYGGWAALAFLVTALALPAQASPATGPTCFGEAVTIPGTPHDDVINGTDRADVISSFGGNDRVHGRGGNDLICGGGGRDLLVGGPGEDMLNGFADNDTLVGDEMNFHQPGKGNDTLIGGSGNELIVGDVYNPAGGDAIGDGVNDVQAGPGHDKVVGNAYTTDGKATGSGEETILMGKGRDVAVGDAVGSSRAVGQGDDFIRLDEEDDLGVGDAVVTSKGIASGGGRDELTGFTADDVVVGGSYAPRGRANGGGVDDVGGGISGNDIVIGDNLASGAASGGNRDVVNGIRNKDLVVDDSFLLQTRGSLSGDRKNDLLRGGPGDDRLIAVSGNVRCSGGPGFNTDLSRPRCKYSSRIDARRPGRFPTKFVRDAVDQLPALGARPR